MLNRYSVKFTTEFESWFNQLNRSDKERLIARISRLEAEGPGLGRPLVDQIKGSKFQNMKELRSGSIRVLFVFDPKRNCLLLLGGDKQNKWKKWYKDNIPIADDLYEKYLKGLNDES